MNIQPRKILKLDKDSVVFVKRACSYNDSTDKVTMKALNDPNHHALFLLSKIIDEDFFENMPKTFTISTKNSILRFNIQMLKETSPIISKFIQDNPNENNYNINITDDDNILTKFEQLYQGKSIIFEEEEYPLVQRFTKILQIKNCPNCLKPPNLITNEIDSEGYSTNNSNEDKTEICIYQEYFIKFLTRDEYKVFKIKTNKKEYKCNIFAVYTSNVIRKILEADPTATEFVYNFDDKNDEFQLIGDFFNFKQIDLKSSNIDLLKSIAKDLQINCIIKAIDYYNNIEKQNNQFFEKHQNEIDSINELFELLYNIDKHGIEKVKNSIVNSKWSKKEEDIEELAAFILQVIKPSFSLQKEIADLLIELNKEANEDNRLDILTPFIVKKLMTLYWPQYCFRNKDFLVQKDIKKIAYEVDNVNLNNRCVYSFIRILYKRGIIPKEEIIKNLKNYELYNNTFNAFFLPELAEVNSSNFYLIAHADRKQDRSYLNAFNDCINSNMNSVGHCFYLPKIAQKYFPDKIELYERMLDNMEPEDEIAKSIRRDDVDELQRIIIKDRINIQEYKVLYNIFDDLEEDQSLINYSALYGSIKCFKYLKLNDGEIDDNTFYFSILGCNNEIIKIVEQNMLKNDKNKEIEKQKERSSKLLDRNSITYYDCNSGLQINSFWFCINRRHIKNKGRYRSRYDYDHDIEHSIDKYNDDNIEYQKRNSSDKNLTIFLNCYNKNNKIAPTIALHKNELFDWSFQKLFLNNKYGKQLTYLADISAMNGNIHSLVTLLENGFHVTKKVILIAAENGFYSLTKLLLDLYDEEKNPDDCNLSFDYKSTVKFGSLSIFKLFINRLNQFDITKAILHAIKKNYTSIIKYVFDNINEFSFIQLNNKFLESALTFSLRIKTNELFDFLIEQFKKLNSKTITINLYCNLLEKSCLASNLPVTKIITEIILKEEPEYDFTTAFFNAAAFKSNEICQYFIDKHVFIDFINNSKLPELGSVDLELFERIINSIDVNYKFLFYECISKAIRYKNIPVIEFILKENPPRGNELFESIRTEDVEIVDLILKYNSKASFINQKGRQGTALCVAIEQQNYEIVERLLSIPEIDPSIMNDMSHDALIIAVNIRDIKIIEAILNFYGDRLQSNIDILIRTFDLLTRGFYDDFFFTDIEWEIVKLFSSLEYFNVSNIYHGGSNNNSHTILHQACFENRIDVVELFLQKENVDPNLSGLKNNDTPLMTCLEKKYTKMAELLIEHPKTNINLRNVYNESALIIAVKNEEQEIIEILLKDSRFEAQESLLNLAFIYSKGEITNQLYSNENLDVNEEFEIPNSTSKGKINALMHSVSINDKTKIDQILSHRTFNIYKSRITKSIFIAAKNNNIEVLEKLISLINNDYNIYNEERQSLLAFSSNHLSSSIIEKILKNELFDTKNDHLLYSFTQSYSNPQNKQKKTIEKSNKNNNNNDKLNSIWQTNQEVLNPESIPDKSSMIEVMELFLEYDKEHQQEIKFEELLPNGKSFITIISRDFSNIREVGEFLISSGVDPNKPDKFNVYPLEHAIKINSIELVKTLVNTERIDFSQIGEGITYLHLAASNKDSTILSFLLEKNAIDVNSVDSFGETPFMYACKAKCINNINLLFKIDNLDYLHRNEKGKDALDNLIQLPQNELDSITKSREKYHQKLISIIEEKLNSAK